jgi:hypothetical protein
MEKVSVGYRLLNALGFELFELYPVERLSVIAAYFKAVCRVEEIEDSCKKPIWIARFSTNILTGKSAGGKPDCVFGHCAVCSDSPIASSEEARSTDSVFKC